MSVSVCMIVLDGEKTLPACLESIRKAPLKEIVVVDTGSTDKTREIALSFGAQVYDFTYKTHPAFFYKDDKSTGAPPPYTGKHVLADFSAARNFSFSKATGDFIFTLDADDLVRNPERLADVEADMVLNHYDCGWFRYVLTRDEKDNVANCTWRERIIRRGCGIEWKGPVHECMVPCDQKFARFSYFAVDHCQQPDRKIVKHRNFKILLRKFLQQKGKVEPRDLFYLAQESIAVDAQKAAILFNRYIGVSDWDEERCQARMMLGEMYEFKNNFVAAWREYAAAAVDVPKFPEPWFGMARIEMYKKKWHRCVEFTERGFQLGNPDAVLMTDQLARKGNPHIYYNYSLNQIGRTKDALASCVAGLEYLPTHPDLLNNKKCFEGHILKMEAEEKAKAEALEKAKESVAVSDPVPVPSSVDDLVFAERSQPADKHPSGKESGYSSMRRGLVVDPRFFKPLARVEASH